MLRTRHVVVLALIALGTCPARAAEVADPPNAAPVPDLEATVKEVHGTVEWRPSPEDPWQAATVGQTLPAGADVRTGFRARIVLDLVDSLVQIDPLTVARVAELRPSGDTVRTRIHLKVGRTQSVVEKDRMKSDFAIVTPSTTLSVKGTRGIQCGYWPDTGGQFGLTTAGRIGITSRQTGRETDLVPGQSSDDTITGGVQHLAQNRRSGVPAAAGLRGQEVVAATRRGIPFTSTPFGSGAGLASGALMAGPGDLRDRLLNLLSNRITATGEGCTGD